ncbi:hypothetical protein HK104_000813, partial [Borealophlyctis nickersoniae]
MLEDQRQDIEMLKCPHTERHFFIGRKGIGRVWSFLLVRLLLRYGANVRSRYNCALVKAAWAGHHDVVQLLLENGTNFQANRALLDASNEGHLEVVRLLLNAGADVHANNDVALHRAACEGQLEVVQLLLDSGADLHAMDDRALGRAASEGHPETVDAGA